MDISADFEKRVSGAWGDDGKQWLKNLPDILDQCATKWDLTMEKSTYRLSYNYVTNVKRRSGQTAVLKVGYPHRELFQEMDAVIAFSSGKGVKVLETDRDLGAMLLQKIMPGTTLAEISEDEATEIAVDIIKDFPVDVPEDKTFPKLSDWANVIVTMKKETCPFSHEHLIKAEKIFVELEMTKKIAKLLHGDLHHDNILKDETEGWIVIDPKGVIGDPTYEAARFLHNPPALLEENFDPEVVLEKRIKIFAERMKQDRSRIIKWTYFDCVLTACWALEDNNDGWKNSIECAEIFESML